MQKYIGQCFLRRLMRGVMSGIVEHCYEVGLWIYHTSWRCCTLDCDSKVCLVISLLFNSSLHM